MDQRLRVVLDTNVYISGLVFGGTSATILAAAVEGSFVLCVAESLKEEVESTLRENFDWDADDIRAGCEPLWEQALHGAPTVRLTIVAADPDDDRILECALAATADILVTGDDHPLGLSDKDLEAIPFGRGQILTVCENSSTASASDPRAGRFGLAAQITSKHPYVRRKDPSPFPSACQKKTLNDGSLKCLTRPVSEGTLEALYRERIERVRLAKCVRRKPGGRTMVFCYFRSLLDPDTWYRYASGVQLRQKSVEQALLGATPHRSPPISV